MGQWQCRRPWTEQSLLEVMGGSEAEVAGNALNHAEVPKYNVWNPKGSRSK